MSFGGAGSVGDAGYKKDIKISGTILQFEEIAQKAADECLVEAIIQLLSSDYKNWLRSA